MQGGASAGLVAALAEPSRRDRPALRDEAAELSYAELAARVASLADELTSAGLAAGDRALVLYGNGPEHVIAVLAVRAAGAVAVPIGDATGATRLAHVVRDATPRVWIGPEDATGPTGVQASHVDLSAPITTPASVPAPSPVDAEALAFIRYTSGSTGDAKGVEIREGQQIWTSRTLAERFHIDASHRELVVAPIAYSGAWQRVAATLREGGCVAFARTPLSVPGLLEDLQEQQATGFFTPPPLVRMLLAARPERVRAGLAGCRSIEIGSAPVSADEISALLGRVPADARVFVHYGLTECSRALILDARQHPDKLHTVGRPAPEVDVRISAADGAVRPVGEAGEIRLRGPQRARAYWRRADLDAERFRDGWLATGDHGRLDDDGFLVFLGRADDRITSGGTSFFPAEAERELGPVPGVAGYLIAGVPDPRGVLGEVPWAFVVPSVAEPEATRTLLALARRRLPPYMVPRRVVALRELPLTASGKPDRRRAVADWNDTPES